MKRERGADTGAAMVIAITASLLVSLTAATVLGLTFQRFRLSKFRSERQKALYAAEAGLQYAFARLNLDTVSDGNNDRGNVQVDGLRDLVQFDNDPPYVIASGAPGTRAHKDTVDEQAEALQIWDSQLGTTWNITVKIQYNPPPNNDPPFQVRAFSDYDLPR